MPSMLIWSNTASDGSKIDSDGHNETIGERLDGGTWRSCCLCRPYRTTPATSTRRGYQVRTRHLVRYRTRCT